MTLHLADGRSTFLDFREKAPLAATAAMFQNRDGAAVPERSTDSWLAVGVPGTVLGLETARVRYGTLSRQRLMAPAIRLAREGFVLGQSDAGVMALEGPKLAREREAAQIFLPRGKPLTKGDRLVQANLAATLALIAAAGPDAFYRGPIGTAVAAAVRKGGGIMTADDFARSGSISARSRAAYAGSSRSATGLTTKSGSPSLLLRSTYTRRSASTKTCTASAE